MRQGGNNERVPDDEQICANFAKCFPLAGYDQSVSDKVRGGEEE
jgi:hypothetical protein